MTSMRIDGDKSAKVWARRLKNLVDDMKKDGVAIESGSPIKLYKDGQQETVQADSEAAKF